MLRLGLGLGLQGQAAGTGGGTGDLEIVGTLGPAQYYETYTATLNGSGGSGTYTAGSIDGLPRGLEYTFNDATGALDIIGKAE